jgi:UDPglucose--hexose-1-phosphate uridylyltransferase
MGTFIFDELTGIPTVLATNRIKRTDQTGAVNKTEDSDPNRPKPCLFCKGNESLTPPAVYQDADDWHIRVFPNKFPIVDYHEIIVHSPEHDKDLTDLPEEQNVRYVRALLNRVNYYTSQGLEVMVFNNRGGKAGASILHPHSQIVALAGFPGIIEMEKNHALRYYNEHHSCYWCDTWKSELVIKERVVYESKHFVLVVPKASRWSYEMILVPKSHKPNFEYINEVEINDFARILKSALYAYDKLFSRPDRNFWIHTQRYDPFHWHVGFIPHIKVFGGLELGAGIWVSDRVTPEDAAKQLSEVVKPFFETSPQDGMPQVGSIV